jgi:AcrR family transcriptional regulator
MQDSHKTVSGQRTNEIPCAPAPSQVFKLTINGRTIRSAEVTQATILDAATEEFADNGFSGARVDTIALRAKTNKRMLYHYFTDKAGLYLAVLERIFTEIMIAEKGLDLKSKQPEAGIRELALFMWTYFLAHQNFVRIVSADNQLNAQYLKQSQKITLVHSHFMEELTGVLQRGSEIGVFRQDIDPALIHLTIISMSFYYITNKHTISVHFGQDTSSAEATSTWGEHIIATLLASLK